MYFEVGRSHMYHELGYTYNDLAKKGILLPVVEAHCEYKYPARYDDVLEVCTTISEVREKSLKTECEVYNERGTLLVRGYCIQVCVDGERNPCPIPEVFQKKLIEVVED